MPTRNFTDSEEVQIGTIYLSGKSTRAIAKAYGLSHHISVTSALKRQNIKQRPKPERNRLYKVNQYIFDEIDNEAKAYWWGFLYADGHTHRRSLILSLSTKDKKQLEKYRAFLQTDAPVRIYSNKANGKKYKRASVEITHQHLTKRAKELGIKTGRPSPRHILEMIPPRLFNHWLRGFFDGDGSATKAKSVDFCGSLGLMELLKRIIAKQCNTNPNLKIVKHTTANLYYLSYSGRINALKVADYMYQDATIWMERKRSVIESWPKPQKRERNKKGQFI